MKEYDIEVKLLFWGNNLHREIITLQHYDEEQARLDAYYKVLDRHNSAIYGESTVIAQREI